jgi:hypothetical protein
MSQFDFASLVSSSVSSMIKAQKTLLGAVGKRDAAISVAMNAMVDKAHKSGLEKNRANCDALGKAIRDNEEMKAAVTAKIFEKTTIQNYAQGAMRAFYHGIAWESTLFTDKSKKLPWGKTSTKKDDDKEPSEGSTTTRAELDATLSKAIQQARALGLIDFAADLLDHCIESLADFKEVAAK